MIASTLALTATLLATAPAYPPPSDAPTLETSGIRIASASPVHRSRSFRTDFTSRDAPTTPFQSFLASGFTSATGLVVLTLALNGRPNDLPGSGFSFHARLSTALLLLSAGPSVGDLLNDDLRGFLIGAGGRSAIAAGAYGLILLASNDSGGPSPVLGLTIVAVTMASIGWVSWSITDLVRSFFAPRRWANRKNRALAAHPRAPIAEVRQTGALRLF